MGAGRGASSGREPGTGLPVVVEEDVLDHGLRERAPVSEYKVFDTNKPFLIQTNSCDVLDHGLCERAPVSEKNSGERGGEGVGVRERERGKGEGGEREGG